jgi:hypothetical protein
MVATYFGRFSRYTSLAAEEMYTMGRKARLLDILLRPASHFFKMYFAKLGMLDGLEGFILSAFSSFYVFVKYVKLWELGRREGR